jgi:hypothetical protein
MCSKRELPGPRALVFASRAFFGIFPFSLRGLTDPQGGLGLDYADN